jgi:hypothetical protein
MICNFFRLLFCSPRIAFLPLLKNGLGELVWVVDYDIRDQGEDENTHALL